MNSTIIEKIDELAQMIFDKYHGAPAGSDFQSLVIDARCAEDLAIAAHALLQNRGSEDAAEEGLAAITFVLTMLYRDKLDDLIQENM